MVLTVSQSLILSEDHVLGVLDSQEQKNRVLERGFARQNFQVDVTVCQNLICSAVWGFTGWKSFG